MSQSTGKYIVVKDLRDDKLYIDEAGTMIRTFEEVIDRSDLLNYLIGLHPTATVLIERETVTPERRHNIESNL